MAKILIIIELIILGFIGFRHVEKQKEVKSIKYVQEEIKNWQEFQSLHPDYLPGQQHLQQLQQELLPQALP